MDFRWVYIKEAHPVGSRRPSKKVEIEQPTTFDGRLEVARSCAGDIRLTIPIYVDDMENSVATAYHAMPDRLFLVGADGRIAYRGARGPRGFKVEELEKALAALR